MRILYDEAQQELGVTSDEALIKQLEGGNAIGTEDLPLMTQADFNAYVSTFLGPREEEVPAGRHEGSAQQERGVSSVAFKVVMFDKESGFRTSWSNSYGLAWCSYETGPAPISRVFYDEDKYSYAHPAMVKIGLGLCVFGCLDDAKKFATENGRRQPYEIWLVEISENSWVPKVPLHYRPDTLEQAKQQVLQTDFAADKWPTGTLMTDYVRLVERVYVN